MINTLVKILAVLTYISMVFVNFFANTLPINNRSTGQISDTYPNLFTPAGITFSIWGLIYLLLAGYTLYQFKKNDQKTEDLVNRLNPLFIATSFANTFWIFAWHYDYIGISVVIMLSLLFVLIRIADILRVEKLESLSKFLISIPFSIYFGWITVATIANITVLLVSINWNGFGISDSVWTVIILLVGAVIGILRMQKDRNIPYGLVFVWAYLGILLKHMSVDGFNGEYPNIVSTVVICLILYLISIGKLLLRK